MRGRQPTRDRVLLAMAVTQLFGLLRFAEAGHVGGGAPVLRRRDVRFLPEGVRLDIQRGKTQILLERQFVVVGAARESMRELDVPALVAEMVAMHDLPSDAPLFPGDGGHAITRPQMNAFVQRVVKASGARAQVSKEVQFSAHSWRAGGATALRAGGADAETVMRAGRWRSYCFAIYTASRIPEMARYVRMMMKDATRVAAAER